MTAVNLNRAVRGPVTAVPIVAGKGVRLVADTQNNRWVIEADETVDQTYDPTSTNAQSGTAVAQAVGTKQDTLTAGDGIDITSNVIKWLNTAGITDIQYVQSLPADPDAHTLYLIPET